MCFAICLPFTTSLLITIDRCVAVKQLPQNTDVEIEVSSFRLLFVGIVKRRLTLPLLNSVQPCCRMYLPEIPACTSNVLTCEMQPKREQVVDFNKVVELDLRSC